MKILFHNYRIRKIICFVFMLLLSGFTIMFFWAKESDGPPLDRRSRVEGFVVRSQDGVIEAVWKENKASNLNCYKITVEDENGSILLTEEYDTDATSFEFEDGEHGKAYTIKILMILSDGSRTREISSRNLFLNYSQLPDVPFLNIQTVSGNFPSFEWIAPPEGAIGYGITDNPYEAASMTIMNGEADGISENIEIRVRGNTSSLEDKKSYKVKLDIAKNLLNPEEKQYAHTDWLLVSATDLKFLVGTETAILCGMEWQPRYRYVNVMINGDYLGGYWLTEAIDVAKHRCDIEKDGYLIELDAYWWNSEGNYFKVEDQSESMGYTFKYPEEEYLSEQTVSDMRNFINGFQNCLYAQDPHYADYIDIRSWAGWLLTHDILGTWDCGGSNMYYYKQDFDPLNIHGSKLKMGPVWDFDTIYRQIDDWARIREINDAYFPYLLAQPDFYNEYLSLWNNLSDTLTYKVDEKIRAFTNTNGTAIQDSFLLECTRWKKEPKILDDEVKFIHDWFEYRTKWIEQQLTE